MKLNYTAEHVLRFDLNEPFIYRNLEVDRLRIEVMWVDAEPLDEQPEGWYVKADFYGWPLTNKGKRDKRSKEREYAYHYAAWPYPYALKAVVWEAWDATVARTGIDTNLVVNPDEGLLGEKVWAPAPKDVYGGVCSDCGIAVTYDDVGTWPWLGADGSTTCSVRDNGIPWGHRLDRTVADAIWATHERLTGTKARHF